MAEAQARATARKGDHGGGNGRSGPRRVAYLPDTDGTLTPEANLATIRSALRAEEATAALCAGFSAVEHALSAIALALNSTQPHGGDNRLAIRWWKLEGSNSVLRTPVLVREVRRGSQTRPERVKRSDVKPRQDGHFTLNADLAGDLVAAYWQQYRQWRELADLWRDFRSLRRREVRITSAAEKAARHEQAQAEAAERTARGRLEAAGYDVSRIGEAVRRDAATGS